MLLQRRRVSALWDWRDVVARREDESTAFVLPNKALFRLAAAAATAPKSASYSKESLSEGWLRSAYKSGVIGPGKGIHVPPLVEKYVADVCKLLSDPPELPPADDAPSTVEASEASVSSPLTLQERTPPLQSRPSSPSLPWTAALSEVETIAKLRRASKSFTFTPEVESSEPDKLCKELVPSLALDLQQSFCTSDMFSTPFDPTDTNVYASSWPPFSTSGAVETGAGVGAEAAEALEQCKRIKEALMERPFQVLFGPHDQFRMKISDKEDAASPTIVTNTSIENDDDDKIKEDEKYEDQDNEDQMANDEDKEEGGRQFDENGEGRDSKKTNVVEDPLARDVPRSLSDIYRISNRNRRRRTGKDSLSAVAGAAFGDVATGDDAPLPASTGAKKRQKLAAAAEQDNAVDFLVSNPISIKSL